VEEPGDRLRLLPAPVVHGPGEIAAPDGRLGLVRIQRLPRTHGVGELREIVPLVCDEVKVSAAIGRAPPVQLRAREQCVPINRAAAEEPRSEDGGSVVDRERKVELTGQPDGFRITVHPTRVYVSARGGTRMNDLTPPGQSGPPATGDTSPRWAFRSMPDPAP